ncbi:hypothetical protein [Paenibacillus gansuensis]|uniref:YgiT-type zinc finger domain-containing protein n=1 Tax=Paenibacillus gansuensis TaxID=306542 RepID=A0ABW5PD57_9BACL
MHKPCTCGQKLAVKLRTVIYTGKVEIENVPIYSCDLCKHSEVLQDVKEDLKQLIAGLGGKPGKQTLRFNEMNELADIIYSVSEKETLQISVKRIIEERINQLLDLLLVAQSAGDEEWADEIRSRLSQISKHTVQK